MENESIKMKLTHLQNVSVFYGAICELADMKLSNVGTILNIIRAKKESKKLMDEFNEVREKILLDVCLKDENGEPLVANNQYTFESEEIALSVKNNLAELEKKEIELECTPIDIHTLSNAQGLKANLIENLGEFIKY